jgi:hypothetical protein
LLLILRQFPAPVAFTCYHHPIYLERVPHWHREDYQITTRGGPRTETCYANFRPPDNLHDHGHLGADKREREKLARRRRTITGRFARYPADERRQLLEALATQHPADFADALAKVRPV